MMRQIAQVYLLASNRKRRRPTLGLQRQLGFTLVELAIVLLIVGVLARVAIQPLGARVEHQRRDDVDQQLQGLRRLLIGHVITTGRLPCPLPDGDHGDSADRGQCSVLQGALPGGLLGAGGPMDESGAVLDVHGRPLLYAVSQADSAAAGRVGISDWTAPGEIQRVGLANAQADLVLCSVVDVDNCSNAAVRAGQIVWTLLSRGPSTVQDDSPENVDGDRWFEHRAYSARVDQPFDDQIIWMSRSEMAYWLLRSGWFD